MFLMMASSGLFCLRLCLYSWIGLIRPVLLNNTFQVAFNEVCAVLYV